LRAQVFSPVLCCAAAGLLLACLPAAWVTNRRVLIALRVAASWLIAVAMLGALLQFLPVTPGYLPDHLE
jgi:hypothetical protein